MSSTSQKHKSFTSEPIRNKAVTALPGVGKAIGQKLESNGCRSAENVLGHYLLMNKDKGRFESWMKDTSNANSKQSGDCYRGLKDWSNEFM